MHMEGLQNPELDVNRMIFVWAGWTYHTNKVGDLVPMDFLSLLPGESVYICDFTKLKIPSNNFRGYITLPDAL